MNTLSVGRTSYHYSGGGSSADGSLVLGSNSILSVGTAANLGVVNIGLNSDDSGGSMATGVLDARDGSIDLRLSELNVGYGERGKAATGTFTMGSGSEVNVGTVRIGTGTNATGTVNLTAGVMTANTINLDAGAFNFTGGRLAVETFHGTLNQEGGTLAPGLSPGTTQALQ